MKQCNFFETNEDFEKYLEDYKLCKKNGKRVHETVPTYVKFYTVYQYNRDLYRKKINEWLETPEGESRTIFSLYKKHNEILNECYLKDEFGGKKRDCDEKHIFRSSSLNYEPEYSAETKKRTPGLHALIYRELQNMGAIPLLTLMQRVGHTIAPTTFEQQAYELDGLMIHPSEAQAEVKNTWHLSIKERVLIHKKYLSMLRNRDKVLYSSLKSIQNHTGFIINKGE